MGLYSQRPKFLQSQRRLLHHVDRSHWKQHQLRPVDLRLEALLDLVLQYSQQIQELLRIQLHPSVQLVR